MNTGFFTHPLFLEHNTGSHPENANRLKVIQSRLESENLLESLILCNGRPATLKEVGMLHAKSLITEVEEAYNKGYSTLQSPDCVVSEKTFDAALHAVGSILVAVEEVAERRLDNAFCAVRPPGHHAERDEAMGFCFFNSIALAAEYLTSQLGYKKILIFDFDVHHGNGTQHLLECREDILYVSTHQHPNTCYPGTGYADEKGTGPGNGYTINLPLLPGTDDVTYKQQVEQELLPLLSEFSPDFILVSAGFDAHRDDPLASLNLTNQSFTWLTKYLKTLANKSAGGRIVSLLEGGYNLDALSLCVAEHLKVLKQDN